MMVKRNRIGTTSEQSGTTPAGEARRIGSLGVIYGFVVYAMFLAALVYVVLFVEGIIVPKGIDDGEVISTAAAVAINVALLVVFACQHSIMARPAFKRWWTRLVPRSVERATYVLFSTGALVLIVWQWRPIPDVLWEVQSVVGRNIIYGVSFAGWGVVLLSTFLIDHLHFFGLKQVLRARTGNAEEPPSFQTPVLYRVVRHPLYLGFLIAFWAAPTLTVGRLLFNVATTAYILIAVRFEEHDLVEAFGDQYRRYRERTPMLLPSLRHPKE